MVGAAREIGLETEALDGPGDEAEGVYRIRGERPEHAAGLESSEDRVEKLAGPLDVFDHVKRVRQVVGTAGDWAVFEIALPTLAQEAMLVHISTHEGVPISMELPARVTLEIVETEPVVKGQTASGSYKPAVLSNGLRIMIPTYITVGTKVVVHTEDGSYMERAKE